MSFKALRLDGADIIQEVVELQSAAELTQEMIDLRPHGGECDLPPGRYRWDRTHNQAVPIVRRGDLH